MSQPDLQTRELDDEGHGPPAQSRPPANRRAAVGAIGGALLIVALSVTVFVSFAAHKAPHVGAGATPTLGRMPAVTITPTALAWSAPQPPRRGTGLPRGVEIIVFTLTGPDEGWATGGSSFNPLYGEPARGMIYHYAHGTWTQIGATLSGYLLGGLYMDSPTDGWVMGGDAYAHNILLHISGSSYQEVSPPEVDPHAVPNILTMRTPNDGWLVMSNMKGEQGGANTSLFHYQNGAWSEVANTPHYITDLVATGDGEAWVTGWGASSASSQLYHVQGGVSSLVLSGPPNSTFWRLRMFAPNDIWIEGAQHDSSNADINDTPLNYHYDGSSWTLVNLHAPNYSQHVGIVSSNTAWSFYSVQPQGAAAQTAYGLIAAIYSNAGGRWHALGLPYGDLQSLQVVGGTDADVWAIGVHVIETEIPGSNGTSFSGVSHYVLLHYSNGSWTEWGR